MSAHTVSPLIYLDHASSTPVDWRVARVMCEILEGADRYGNPSSLHRLGGQALLDIEDAQTQAAQCIGADVDEIVWTSGATESNNLAILGVAHAYAFKGKHLITWKSEHKSVLGPCEHLEKQGFEVTYLDVNPEGQIDLEALKHAITDQTILINCLWVNNETGVTQPIDKIIEIAHARGVLVHIDAVQAFLTQSLQVHQLGADLLSLSAHKLYGPKGVGLLYLRRRPKIRIQPLLFGGSQQRGIRPGTQASHQIVGMAQAMVLAEDERAARIAHFQAVKLALIEALKTAYPAPYYFNGSVDQTAPHILNVCFPTLESSLVKTHLPHVLISQGSACNSTAVEPSHVLSAMRRTSRDADRSFRFSFGVQNQAGEMVEVVRSLALLQKQ